MGGQSLEHLGVDIAGGGGDSEWLHLQDSTPRRGTRAFNTRVNDSGLNVVEATGAAGPTWPRDFAMIQP